MMKKSLAELFRVAWAGLDTRYTAINTAAAVSASRFLKLAYGKPVSNPIFSQCYTYVPVNEWISKHDAIVVPDYINLLK